MGRVVKSIGGIITVVVWFLCFTAFFLVQAKEEITRENFDYQQYADTYPDLKNTMGYDADLLWEHYEKFGKQEGRLAGITPAAFLTVDNFNAEEYAASNPDVAAVCGTDDNALLEHYLQYGFREGRTATGLDERTTAKLMAWEIAHEITTVEMSDFEKVKAVHDWIIHETRYDYENNQNGTVPAASCDIEGIILNKTAISYGYAKAFQYFMDVLGINCEVISGNGCWNQVCVDGQWYNIDLRLDDPVYNDGRSCLSYRYFLIDNDTFHEDHTVGNGEKEHDCPVRYDRLKEYNLEETTVWNFLFLIFKNNKIVYIDDAGKECLENSVMSEEEIAILKEALPWFEKDIYEISNGMIKANVEIQVVDVPLTNLTLGENELGYDYSLNVVDAYDLIKDFVNIDLYDHITIFSDLNNIKTKYMGLGGTIFNNYTGYSFINTQNNDYALWYFDKTSIWSSAIIVHEFLHFVETWSRTLNYERVLNYEIPFRLHDGMENGEKYGYTDEEWWKKWYIDFINQKVRLEDGSYAGVPKEVWGIPPREYR